MSCFFIKKKERKKVKVRWSGVLPGITQIFSELVGAAQPLVLFPSFFPRASISCYKIIASASTPNLGFPGGFKESTCKAGGSRSCRFDPCVGKICWRRTWQPTPVSCLENPMDRGAWWATVHRVAKSRTQPKLLSTHTRRVKWV